MIELSCHQLTHRRTSHCRGCWMQPAYPATSISSSAPSPRSPQHINRSSPENAATAVSNVFRAPAEFLRRVGFGQRRGIINAGEFKSLGNSAASLGSLCVMCSLEPNCRFGLAGWTYCRRGVFLHIWILYAASSINKVYGVETWQDLDPAVLQGSLLSPFAYISFCEFDYCAVLIAILAHWRADIRLAVCLRTARNSREFSLYLVLLPYQCHDPGARRDDVRGCSLRPNPLVSEFLEISLSIVASLDAPSGLVPWTRTQLLYSRALPFERTLTAALSWGMLLPSS